MPALVKKSHRLTLRDRLSRFTYQQACKLLGDEGKRLITKGSRAWEIDIQEQVYFQGDLFRVKFPSVDANDVVASITVKADARDRLLWNCTHCETACEHVGAMFSLILEEKTPLGLAMAPPERVPADSLGEKELVDQALTERRKRARSEKMIISNPTQKTPWTDYVVTSAVSGKTYRVALRGLELGQAFCTCPDFRTNTLGTCKHVMKVLEKVQKRFTPKQLKRPYEPKQLALHLRYGNEVTLHFEVPRQLDSDAAAIVGKWTTGPIQNVSALMKSLAKLEAMEHSVTIYPDAEEFIQQRLFRDQIQARVDAIRENPTQHHLRSELLKVELLPYQLDGIAFAVGARRAILADDMGLGKTIQGIGVAELLAREAGIRKVLVVCPASVKSQWRGEIQRFCDRECQLIGGSSSSRLEQYDNPCFFTICNYEQVLRDISTIEKVKWDLIVLDEGQRIKNWEAKTSNVIKSLRSTFALVLSGTPLENRLEDLYSVAQFIDDRRLGPMFRFYNRHHLADEKGKLLGYKNLDQLRENLRPLLLRRTRESVRLELPPRTTEVIRIPPTDEQMGIHSANMRVVASITRKPFISEMDLLRLRQALLMCRMVADSTYLTNREEPAFSTKLGYLNDLFERLFQEPDRKVILFSEWTTMLDLIEKLLQHQQIQYVRLDGSVPQAKRPQLVREFQTDPNCRMFLTTNAGSTGLNLQAANTVINVDLPWNPAVLEQRIARAHRMGQQQPVQVYILVSEGTIEEQLLQTLSAKKELALAALDMESDVSTIDLTNRTDDLKQRLEILLGARPEALPDESVKQQRQSEVAQTQRRERVAAAGGELLGAAFNFLGELVASQLPASPVSPTLVSDMRNRLAECVEQDESGKSRLSITLPNAESLNNLAEVLTKLLAIGKGGA